MNVHPIRFECAVVGGGVDSMRQGLGSAAQKKLAWARFKSEHPELWAPTRPARIAALESAFQRELARLRLLENAWATVYWQVFLTPMAVSLSAAELPKDSGIHLVLAKAGNTFEAAKDAGTQSVPYRYLIASLYDSYLQALATPAAPIPCGPEGLHVFDTTSYPVFQTTDWWFGTNPWAFAPRVWVALVISASLMETQGQLPAGFSQAQAWLKANKITPDSSSYFGDVISVPSNGLGPASQLAAASAESSLEIAKAAPSLVDFSTAALRVFNGLYRDLWTNLRGTFWQPAALDKGMTLPSNAVPSLDDLPPLPCFGPQLRQSVVSALVAAENHASPEPWGHALAKSWLRLRRLLALRFLLGDVDRGEHIQLSPLLRDWATFDGRIVRPALALTTTRPNQAIDFAKFATQSYAKNTSAANWATEVLAHAQLSGFGV